MSYLRRLREDEMTLWPREDRLFRVLDISGYLRSSLQRRRRWARYIGPWRRSCGILGDIGRGSVSAASDLDGLRPNDDIAPNSLRSSRRRRSVRDGLEALIGIRRSDSTVHWCLHDRQTHTMTITPRSSRTSASHNTSLSQSTRVCGRTADTCRRFLLIVLRELRILNPSALTCLIHACTR